MKSHQGVTLAVTVFALLFFIMTAWSVWHMAGLYDRIHTMESSSFNTEVTGVRMKDHAQTKIELINAAIKVAEQVEIKSAFPLEPHEQACLRQLKRAVADYKETKQVKRVDENGEEFDSFHGTG
jgi:hypothetical protein